MNPEGGQDRRLLNSGPSFSIRLAQKLESSLSAQLQLLGLELQAIEVDDVPDDDILEVLTGGEISIHIKVRASYCKP